MIGKLEESVKGGLKGGYFGSLGVTQIFYSEASRKRPGGQNSRDFPQGRGRIASPKKASVFQLGLFVFRG